MPAQWFAPSLCALEASHLLSWLRTICETTPWARPRELTQLQALFGRRGEDCSGRVSSPRSDPQRGPTKSCVSTATWGWCSGCSKNTDQGCLKLVLLPNAVCHETKPQEQPRSLDMATAGSSPRETLQHWVRSTRPTSSKSPVNEHMNEQMVSRG